MWYRREGDYWHMRPEYCYPGVQIFIQKQGPNFSIIMQNIADRPLMDIEVARTPKEAYSRKTWRTVTAAKRNANFLRYDRDWLQSAGITFNEKITNMPRYRASDYIYEAKPIS